MANPAVTAEEWLRLPEAGGGARATEEAMNGGIRVTPPALTYVRFLPQ
jgi:hypothetical protein